jgi:hypothetical protein
MKLKKNQLQKALKKKIAKTEEWNQNWLKYKYKLKGHI